MKPKLEKGRFLIACSGGPDSMFLLNSLKHLDPLVAHVNYQLRPESDTEEELVRSFCQTYKLRFVLLRASLESSKNFQHNAREVRYNFFYDLVKKHNLSCILTAHHRDDLLEGYFLKLGCKGFFSSTPQRSFWKDVPVFRPLLYTHWKKQILKLLISLKIPFSFDTSNSKLIYTRNKIRASLQTLSLFSKYCLLLKCWVKEKKNFWTLQRSQKLFLSWKQNGFKIAVFNCLTQKERVRQLILFFQDYPGFRVKYSSRKLGGIISFLLATNHANSFKLNRNLSLKKTKTKRLEISQA